MDGTHIDAYMETINKKLEDLSREELIKRFVSVEFNRFLDYYSDAVDINIKASSKEDRDSRKGDREGRVDKGEREGKRNRKDMEYSRFYINLGTKNGINPGKLIGLLTKNPDFKSIEIGDIELFKKFSFVEVDKNFEGQVFDYLEKSEYQGVPVRIELTKSKATPPQNTKAKRRYDSGGSTKDRYKRSGDKKFGGKKFGEHKANGRFKKKKRD